MRKLKLQVFGKVQLESSGGGKLDEEELRSGKLTSLMVYVIMNRDLVLTQQRLIEVFCEDGSRNPENTLRNLMYRLRSAMKILGEENFILTLPAAYRWNPDVAVETDYEAYEREAAQLKETSGDVQDAAMDEQKKRCLRMIDLYHTGSGNISRKISDTSWLLPKKMLYHSLYLKAARILCGIYQTEKDWPALEATARRAVEEDPFDEDLQCWLILGLHRQKKNSEAMEQYENARNSFYEGLGVRNAEKLQKVFREMMTGNEDSVVDMNVITADFCETEKPQGIFFCDYQVFREIYILESRRVMRSGIAEYVMLLTLRRTGTLWKQAIVDSGLMDAMKLLEKQVSVLLRTSDVAARCSPTQIIILLVGCSYENGIRIGQRIQESFYKAIGKRRIELVYDLEEVPGLEER